MITSLLGDRGRTRHVFIRRVRARTDQGNTKFLGPVVLNHRILKLRKRRGKVRREWTVDVGLKLVEVNLDVSVILSVTVGQKVATELRSSLSNVCTARSLKVLGLTGVEWEDRCRSTNFSTHVTNGTHTGGRKRGNTRSLVLNNCTSTTLNSELAGNLKDDVLRCGPARQLTLKLNTNYLRTLQLPRNVSHHINSISTADTASNHVETTSVWSVRVRTDHETTREGVVLNDNLMNDTRTRLPEANTVLGTAASKEIVDLLVQFKRVSKVL